MCEAVDLLEAAAGSQLYLHLASMNKYHFNWASPNVYFFENAIPKDRCLSHSLF
jgi:hypothetical protein